MSEHAGALLALWNDVAPELDAQYNDWHANEHVPERLTVPGILWGRRYGNPEGTGAPRYLTLYGLRDADVLESAPYQQLLREPTPMSRTMRPALQNVSRWVCKLHREAGSAEATHLAVWTLPEEAIATQDPTDALVRLPGAHGCLLAERLPEARPLPWLGTGQDAGIEGHWLLCAALDASGASGLALSDAVVYERLPVRGDRPPR